MIKEQPWVCCFIINQILITSALSRYSSYGDCWTEHCLWHSYIRDYIQSMLPKMRKSYCLPLAMQTKLLIRAVLQASFKEDPTIPTHHCKVLWALGIKVLCYCYSSENMALHPFTSGHGAEQWSSSLTPALLEEHRERSVQSRVEDRGIKQGLGTVSFLCYTDKWVWLQLIKVLEIT